MEIIPYNVNKIRVTNRPIAVPYNYRISYKICQLLLIISTSNNRATCTLEKIQIISHALTSEKILNDLLKFIETDSIMLIKFDPIVNRVISFALAEQLITQQKNGKYKLTRIGKEFVQLINYDKELMKNEKNVLFRINASLTDEKIEKLIKMWV